MLSEKADWDPEPHERTYYRHLTTGDLGWLVQRDRKTWIRLDRFGSEQLRPWRNGIDWSQDNDVRPISDAHIARISYEADRAYKMVTGLGGHTANWHSLKDEERIKWVKSGPGGSGIRAKLDGAIRIALDAK